MKVTEQIEFKVFDKAIERFKELEQKHNWIDYLISPVIVMVILLTVYAIKGVYPFGRNTIAYYDMPTQYVQFYSNAWDILHGKVGLFFTWYFGLGSANAAGLGNFIYFPTNLFLYFTSRDNILYSLSFLLMLNMILSAYTMSFYSIKRYGFSMWTICSGILYACSGFVIQYYTNLFFLDYVVIFPMIVWSLERLMNEHKYRIFILFMFLAFIPNFQLAGMVVIYLIIKTYFMLETIPSEKRGRSLRLFAISGIIALLLSMIVMLPSLIISLGSSRMDLNNDFNYFNVLKAVYSDARKQKQFMMYGGEAAVGLSFLLLLRGKAEIKKYWEHIIMIILLVLPILMEGINLLWHFGSYKHFPIRFGYMISFELLIFVNCYLKENDMQYNKVVGRVAKLLGIAVIPFVAYILFAFFKQFLHNSITDFSSYESYKVYFLTLSAVFFIVFLIDDSKSRNVALITLAIIQAFCGCYGLIAPETAHSDGARIKYLMKSLESRSIFEGIQLNKYERIKSDLLDYEPNYALIIEQPSIGLWAYGIPYDTEKMLRNTMGYHGAQSSVMDQGGTVFTDALLGVTNYLSSHGNDSLLYNGIEGKTELYDSVFKLPFGIVTNENEINIEDKSFEFNNSLFSQITGVEEELIQVDDAQKLCRKESEMSDDYSREIRDIFIDNLPLKNPVYDITGEAESSDNKTSEVSSSTLKEENNSPEENIERFNEYVLTIPVEGKKTVYMDVDEDFTGEMTMMLNGNPMFFSSYLTENSNTYPNVIYTGIISLGSYEDEDIELRIFTLNINLDGIKIGRLDHDILNQGINKVTENQKLNIECGKDRMHVTGSVNQDGTLFFPIGYSKDWQVKVNGKRAEVKPFINDAFIAVDVKNGDVDVDFTYKAQGLSLGLLLSFIGTIALFIMNIVMKRGGIAGKKYEIIVDNIVIYGFKGLAVAILIVLYVAPIYVRLSL